MFVQTWNLNYRSYILELSMRVRKVLSYEEKHTEATSNLNKCFDALNGSLLEINEKKKLIEELLQQLWAFWKQPIRYYWSTVLGKCRSDQKGSGKTLKIYI